MWKCPWSEFFLPDGTTSILFSDFGSSPTPARAPVRITNYDQRLFAVAASAECRSGMRNAHERKYRSAGKFVDLFWEVAAAYNHALRLCWRRQPIVKGPRTFLQDGTSASKLTTFVCEVPTQTEKLTSLFICSLSRSSASQINLIKMQKGVMFNKFRDLMILVGDEKGEPSILVDVAVFFV